MFHDFFSFNPQNGRSRKSKGKGSTARPAGATSDGEYSDEDSNIEPAKPVTFDDIINDILRDNNNAQFNLNSDDEGTKNILSDFATGKRDTATGNAALQLPGLFNTDGAFDDSRKNRKSLADIFGDELKEFGQGKLNERWSDLLKKSMQPNFIENLTEDDKKLFGNIMLQKMKDAGIDLKTIPAVTKQQLKAGDEKTFINAWRAIQDRSNKSENAEPIISDKTKKALDDIANRVNELTTSNEENAPQLIADNSKLYREISKLNGEINRLTAEREKLSKAKSNQAAQVDAAGQIAKIDADIKKKQADLDAKINGFYNPPQAKVESQEETFNPANDEVANALEAIEQRKAELRESSGNSKEITALNQRRDKIQRDSNAISKLNQQAETLQEQIQTELDAKKRGVLQDKLDALNSQIEDRTQKLSNFINPPQPVKAEPSKKFAPVKTKADNVIENLNQQIETLRAQGLDDDSPELGQLIDNKFAVQAAVDELAELDGQVGAAIKARNAATKADDTSAYKKAKKQAENKLKQYNKKQQELLDMLNPQTKVEPQEETFNPANDEIANELEAINQRKAELRDNGGTAKEINDLNKRRDKIKRDSNAITELTWQASTLEDQIQSEPNVQKRDKLQDDLDALNSQIEDKTQKLSNFINPPQPPQKETPKNYAPVDDDVKNEISRLNRQILDIPDEGKSDVSAKDITKRLSDLRELNNKVGQAQDRVKEASAALQEVRANGDEQAQIAAKTSFETAKENLAAKQKQLKEFLAPPVKEEKQPQPSAPQEPEHYEPIGEEKAEIDKLDAEIAALREDGEDKHSAEISEKSKRRDAIQNQVDRIGILEDKLYEKISKRNQAESQGRKQMANELTGEIAELNGKLKDANTKLKEILNPRNEDDEPAESYPPVDDNVKAALEELDEQIGNPKNGSAEKENLEKKRREIQNQNDIVARLQNERKELKEKLSRAKDGSKGQQKIQKALDNKERAIANAKKRLDKLLKAMAKRKHGGRFSFGKSISDNGWAMFTQMLEYKLEWQGKTLVRIDKWYSSSQLCSVCGYQNSETKNLSVREWTCPTCGVHHDRDHNAAINIKNEGMRILA